MRLSGVKILNDPDVRGEDMPVYGHAEKPD
jgi:hypothetical protein